MLLRMDVSLLLVSPLPTSRDLPRLSTPSKAKDLVFDTQNCLMRGCMIERALHFERT